MKHAGLIFLVSIFLFQLIQVSPSKSICEQIIANKKLQGDVKNPAYLNSLQKLKTIKHHECIVELEPKYVWAQNMSYIMVKFDFQISSRTSCSQVLYSEKNVTFNSFYLKQYCLQSNQVIKYHIDVTTYKNMNFHFVKWKQTDMNGLILQVLKSPSPYFWPKLYSKNLNPKVKPRIWWELQQKQDDSTQKYMPLLQIDESQVEISSYVRKMNRKSNKDVDKKKESEIQFYCNEGSPFLLGSWY